MIMFVAMDKTVITRLLVLFMVTAAASSAAISTTAAIIHRPSHVLQTTDANYTDVQTSSTCSGLCASSNVTCQAWQYDMDSKICQLSSVPSIPASSNLISATSTVTDTIEFHSQQSGFLIGKTKGCRHSFLTQVINITLDGCIQQHMESSSADGEFSYNMELNACILVLPQTPSAISCSSETNLFVYTNINKRERTAPSKITITGTINSSPEWASRYKAFDGLYGHWNVHFASAGDTENPFISGDIGSTHIVAGAIFSGRADCCNENTVNLHFLVALDESDLDIPERSLCSVYPGPPEHPLLQNYEKLWLPCPLREARFFKIMIISNAAYFNVGEFEIYGY